MESEFGNGNTKLSKIDSESSHNDGDPVVEGKASRSSSSSSSSSASSFDHFFDLGDGKKEVHDNITTKKSESDGHSSPEVSAQAPDWSMISASPRSGPGPLSSPEEHFPQTPEWNVFGASPMQSPPIQTIGRPSCGYDPNRIPSSIFSSKPTTPMEWSVASNESLFSIHMGNNSFSRDLVLFKSGELIRPDELSNFTPNQQSVTEAKSHELNLSPSRLPTVVEVASENHGKSAGMGEDYVLQAAATNKMPNVVTTKETFDHSKESMSSGEGVHCSTSASTVSDGRGMPTDGALDSSSTPRLSDESGNSGSSFAFPLLTGEGGRSASVKDIPESLQSKPPEKLELQQQPQRAQEATPKAAETRWYSCFSCCSFCC